MYRALAVVGVASTVGFALLSWHVVTGAADAFDRELTDTLHVHIGYGLRGALTAFTRLGQGDVMAVAGLAAVIACIRRRQRLLAFMWALMMSAGFALTQLFKVLVGRERPRYADAWLTSDYSFPSGHTSMTLVFVGFALYLFLREERSAAARRAAVVGAALWRGLMGSSRLLLGNHHWSDVMGGYLLGTAWLALFVSITQRLTTRDAGSRASGHPPIPDRAAFRAPRR